MALALSCYIEANSPRWLSALASTGCNSLCYLASRALCLFPCAPASRRKGSESFDEDSPFPSLMGPTLEQPNFEEDATWAWLRKVPGVMLWITVLSSVLLPFYHPVLLSWIIFLTMFQNSITLLFSLAYTYKGFRSIERAMTHPVRIPPLLASTPRGVALLRGGPGSGANATTGGAGTGTSGSVPAPAAGTASGASGAGAAAGASLSTSASLALVPLPAGSALVGLPGAGNISSSAPSAASSGSAHAASDAGAIGGASGAGSGNGSAASLSSSSSSSSDGTASSLPVPGVAAAVATVGDQKSAASLSGTAAADAALIQPAQVLHVIAICRCTEPIEVLQETIDHLAAHSNRHCYIVLLCLEAKDKSAAAVGDALVRQYEGVFSRIMYAIHPGGIETEVPGKSANVNWGARAAYAFLEATMGGAAVDRMVVTVADCDAKVSEHYFNELSVNFAAAALDKREVFWCPPMLFDEGVAEAAMEYAEAAAAAEQAELEAAEGSPGGPSAGLGEPSTPHKAASSAASAAASALSATVGSKDVLEFLLGKNGKAVVRAFFGGAIPAPVKLADQLWSTFHLQNLASVNWVRLPCSTYSVGFRLIASVGFWDTGVESVPEDDHTALKLYWATSGRCRCEPIFHPVLYQHIDGGAWGNTVVQRFHQGVRHMWGATDIAYVLWLSLRAPIVPFWSRVRLVITVFDVHVNASMSSFYSTLGFLVLQAFRSDWLQGEGRTFKHVHQAMIAFAFCTSLLTGLVYEWYALEMVSALKRRPFWEGRSPSGSISGLLWDQGGSGSRSRGASLSAAALAGGSPGSAGGSTPASLLASPSAATGSAGAAAASSLMLSLPHITVPPNDEGRDLAMHATVVGVSAPGSGASAMPIDCGSVSSSLQPSLPSPSAATASPLATVQLSPQPLPLPLASGTAGSSAGAVSSSTQQQQQAHTFAAAFVSIDAGSPRRAGGRGRSNSAALPRGVIDQRDRSLIGALAHASTAGAFVYFLKFLPWFWGPFVCIFCALRLLKRAPITPPLTRPFPSLFLLSVRLARDLDVGAD